MAQLRARSKVGVARRKCARRVGLNRCSRAYENAPTAAAAGTTRCSNGSRICSSKSKPVINCVALLPFSIVCHYSHAAGVQKLLIMEREQG